MTYAQTLWLYTVLLFGIIIVPGMDMFFVMANGLSGGKSRGLAATFGVMAGGIYHTLFGAIAVGLLLSLAPQVLTTLLIASAAYMVWIGYTLIKSSITVDHINAANTKTLAAAFRQGFVTCILNPKAYMFVIAVYPAFIQARFGPVWSQALVMGVLTAAMQFAIYGAVAVAAASGRNLLIRNPVATIWTGRALGAVFIIVALFTVYEALSQLHPV
jgi:threonine/homoserine/homoserine lactone efflux protein